jgi:hypothetical protein
MKEAFRFGLVLLLLLVQSSILHAEEMIHHEMKIFVQPDHHRLEVEDSIRLPGAMLGAKREVRFSLHTDLQPVSLTPGVKLMQEKVVPPSMAPQIQPDRLSW